ncbi:hypothetical protein SAMN02745220_03432 [Desulfopila aestuarii DSM 18488]|uniref:Uncharacterized protein n=1 Tax=Desulfopila aestuarii DSM 18488 TaxID=1121416 RepID=A0A1M7YCX9_9BACT|nr:hypothetical protein SAMN02745220_03432 [Desulfopila aestuarii DSM 18488]
MFTKKIVKTVKLQGRNADGCVANNRQSKEVVEFVTPDRRFSFRYIRTEPSRYRRDGSIKSYSTAPRMPQLLAITGPGMLEVRLKRSAKHDFYEGFIGRQEVNVVLNRISGELRFITYVPLPTHVVDSVIAKGYYGNRCS